MQLMFPCDDHWTLDWTDEEDDIFDKQKKISVSSSIICLFSVFISFHAKRTSGGLQMNAIDLDPGENSIVYDMPPQVNCTTKFPDS